MSGRWPRIAFVALCCLVCLSGIIARGAQVELFVITNAPPSCLYNAGSPMSVTVYRSTDVQAFVWFRLTGVQAGEAPRIEWIDPAGQVFRTGTWTPVTEGGVWCYTSAPFKIADANPQLKPGTWTVRLYMNTTQLASGTFRILEPCRYSVSPASFSFERGANSGSVAVTPSDSFCQWTAATTANWISISSGLSGTGNGTVRFSVGANAGSPRAGTIAISGQTVTVTQSGIMVSPQVVHYRMLRSKPASCDFEQPPANVATFLTTDAEAYLWLAIDNVNIGDVLAREAFTPAGAKYAAWSNAWSPSPLSGGLCFTSGALTIAGAEPASMPGIWVVKLTMNGTPLLTLAFTIQQVVVGPVCTSSLNPGSQSAPAEGGSFNVSVNTGADCPWTAVSGASWISIQSGASGRGGGTVAYRVAANTGSASRTGTLTIAGQTLTVTQSAACTYAIDPASAVMPGSGGTGSVSVKTDSQCRWTAVSNSNWLSVTSGASGSGNGSVSFSAAANTGAASRTGTLTIAGQTFTVQQAGPTVFAQALLGTIAGTDWIFPRGDRDALDAPLGDLKGVAADTLGNLYVADYDNCMIFRIAPGGVLSAVAGNGMCAYSGDGGRATSASISYPLDVQVDGDGNLYISDFGNHRIRRITPDGIISTFAGTGASATSGDGGPARQAALRSPHRLAWDAEGNLYVTTDQRVRRISREGIITTVAGNGETRFAGDGGYATDASFSSPWGVAVDAAGNIYVSDWDDKRIRRITADGIINTFAGDGQYRFAGDGGQALSASLKSPAGLAFDLSGNLFVADTADRRIRKIGPDGTISTVAGDGNLGFTGDGGPATSASLTFPYAVATNITGDLLIADSENMRLRRVSPEGIIQTLAGNGRYRAVNDGASALDVYMNLPTGFTRDAQGNAYVADTLGHRVWKVSPDGTIVSFAGRGLYACCADLGPAVAASMSSPTDVAIDARGDIYIADSIDDRIRKVDAAGKISTFGGTGVTGFGGDGGPVSKAQFDGPSGLAFDSAGNLYVADTNNHRVRKVASDGTITTVAGTGEGGYSGDGGPGTSAKLYYPFRVAVDRAGNLYIADYWNARIRKVTPAGIISTVAGNGQVGFSGDGGPATQAKLYYPQGVAVDQAGNIYIADSWGHRVRMVTPNGLIATIAGNGRAGFSGDGGPALDGSLNRPVDLEVSGDTVYILDRLNNRLRVLQTRIITLEAAPGTLSFTGQAEGGQVQSQAVWISGSSPGLQYSATATTESGGAWLAVSPASGSLPGAIQVTVNPNRVSAAGTYRGTVRVTAAGGAVRIIAVTFQVQESNPPKMEFEPGEIQLSIAEQSQTEHVLWVLNRGGGLLSFTADASGGDWLRVTSSAARATASEPGVVTLGIDARSLAPGTYTGTVTLSTASGDRRQVRVTLAVVGSRKPKLLASHKAVAFLSRAGGGDAPHDVSIVNIGQGMMAWSAEAQSDRGWLSIASSGGTTDAAAATVPVMRVSADPGALAPGEYTGQITIRAPDAEDGVQRIDAKLTVVRDESQLAPIVRPTGMIFRAVNPSAPPGSQEISIFNITSRRVNYDAGLVPQPAVSWFQFTPASGAVPEFTSRQQNMVFLKVQPMLEGAQGAGLREATLTVKLGSINRNINLYLFQPAVSGSPAAAGARSAEGGCAATTLRPIFTTLESEFSAAVGRAVSINVSVVDNCGNPVTAGSVLAAFSNGDASIPLVSLKDGRWAGSWLPKSPAKRVGITVRAWRPGDNLRGEEVLTGNLSAP